MLVSRHWALQAVVCVGLVYSCLVAHATQRRFLHPLSGWVSNLKILKVLVVLLRHLARVLVVIPVVFGVRVEALGVSGIPDGRDDGARVPAVDDVGPVDVAEKGVRLDAAGAAADVAEAPGAVNGAE